MKHIINIIIIKFQFYEIRKALDNIHELDNILIIYYRYLYINLSCIFTIFIIFLILVFILEKYVLPNDS